MVSPSRAEGEDFVMGQDAIDKMQRPPREPMSPDDRFWLWFWAIVGTAIVAFTATTWIGVISYQRVTTPEQVCASRSDPPEFCRELAKRTPAQK